MTLVWGGGIDENLIGAITTVDRTRLDHALEWLKQEANVARRELEELNKLPCRNPYNPKTLKENFKYPPCRRYLGGTGIYTTLPVEWYNHYFKGANWNGSGTSNSISFFLECCYYVSADGLSIGSYNMLLCNRYHIDTSGNEYELKLSVTWPNHEAHLPIEWIPKVDQWGNRLSLLVNYHNKLVDYWGRDLERIPYV